MKCQCCGDQATNIGAKLNPLCEDCYLELEQSVVRNQNVNLGGGNPRGIEDEDTPGWHDCVRALEDYSGL